MHLSILINELLLGLTKVGVGCRSDTGWADCSRSLHEDGPWSQRDFVHVEAVRAVSFGNNFWTWVDDRIKVP